MNLILLAGGIATPSPYCITSLLRIATPSVFSSTSLLHIATPVHTPVPHCYRLLPQSILQYLIATPCPYSSTSLLQIATPVHTPVHHCYRLLPQSILQYLIATDCYPSPYCSTSLLPTSPIVPLHWPGRLNEVARLCRVGRWEGQRGWILTSLLRTSVRFVNLAENDSIH